MVFTFIKYVHPSWQFNIKPHTHQLCASCLVHDTVLFSDYRDKNYQTLAAQWADAGFYLWNKGMLMQSNEQQRNNIAALPAPTLFDEYRFIKKYWGAKWVTYTLLLRLASFKNPFKEIHAASTTKLTRHINVYQSNVHTNEYNQYQSPLLAKQPFVSVIIPTLNRYGYLENALHDLEKQSWKNFEVIVIDQSDACNEEFYKQFSLNIRLIRQTEKKLWTARNQAIKKSKADYLLFFDDDSRVENNWIAEHLKALDYFNVKISAGISLSVVGGKVPANYSYFRWADQFDSGNALVHRSVFETIGYFDEKFNGMRMGDGEFGYRAYINGIASISNPLAARVHLKVKEGGLREMGSWDGFRSTKWFAPKPVPSVLYLYKKYLTPPLYRHAVFMGILLSNVPFRFKKNKYMLLASIFITILKSPLLFIQYQRSKKIADTMVHADGK